MFEHLTVTVIILKNTSEPPQDLLVRYIPKLPSSTWTLCVD